MSIPIQMRPIYGELAEMISDYCGRFLSEDYHTLCLRLLEKLCRKRPSPLLRGRRNTWAAGIVYAIAANNLIFDKSMPIHRTADELSLSERIGLFLFVQKHVSVPLLPFEFARIRENAHK